MARRRIRRSFTPLIQRLASIENETNEALVDLIQSGRVLVEGRPMMNPAGLVLANAAIRILRPQALRGEMKLRDALSRFAIGVHGTVALDVGAAAGGFTRALLEAGARKVYAVDAGYGQLLGSLRSDPRVVNLERTNLGRLDRQLIPETIGIITMDLSYLSIAAAVRQLERLTIGNLAKLIALVKPTFELGLATPPQDVQLPEAMRRAVGGMESSGWAVVQTMESPITGTRGTKEFFVYAKRARPTG